MPFFWTHCLTQSCLSDELQALNQPKIKHTCVEKGNLQLPFLRCVETAYYMQPMMSHISVPWSKLRDYTLKGTVGSAVGSGP